MFLFVLTVRFHQTVGSKPVADVMENMYNRVNEDRRVACMGVPKIIDDARQAYTAAVNKTEAADDWKS